MAPGLLATCYDCAIPIFVGAPGDGSVFLNSMKLWAMRQAGLIPEYGFDLDLHAEVFEACAYHRWGLFDHPVHALGTVILGGGVPKNYNLQPEPALGQVLGLPNVRGYQFDVQIVTAPVTDGSLSSCPPAEAVTWGKVDKDTYLQTTESMQADYSIVMPFLVKALLDNRDALPAHGGARKARKRCSRASRRPAATCVRRAGYRLFEQREELCERLTADVRANREWLLESLAYPAGAKDEYRPRSIARSARIPEVSQLFQRKPIAALVAETEGLRQGLKRSLRAGDLIMLAIGAVIGAGIFGAIGTAAAGQIGPQRRSDPRGRRAGAGFFLPACWAARARWPAFAMRSWPP